MNLQPLYDVKERLEYAAIAGTGLLGEDFRLQRAAENMKPLAAASPVFGKISASLQKLLDAPPEERAGLLLDTLALVDAVAYTQAKSGASGDLEPLEYLGSGTYQQLSRAQLQPLLSALTTTGGGRIDTIKAAWENNPGFFTDFRILPAVVDGLGDGYGEIADLNMEILKKIGPVALPWLRLEFDPAGKRAMGRRVEVIAAIEGADSVPWLKEILPKAKKDVRTSVITALGTAIITDMGTDPENTQLLLDLAKTERSKNRDAVLEGLARQDGEEVHKFWKAELKKNGGTAAWFLGETTADWASELLAEEALAYFEAFFREQKLTQDMTNEADKWQYAIRGKSSPKMLDFWRWMDGHWEDPMMYRKLSGHHSALADQTATWLVDSVCKAGKSPLCDLVRELWDKDPENPRYVAAALVAAALTRPPEEVFDTFSRYVCTAIPPEKDREHIKDLHFAVIQGLAKLSSDTLGMTVTCNSGRVIHFGNDSLIENFDKRWLSLLTESVWTQRRKSDQAYYQLHSSASVISMDVLDVVLSALASPSDPEACAIMVPYLRRRMAETGGFYAYGYMILRYHGSFVGVLEKSLHNNNKLVYGYNIWDLFRAASESLSNQELVNGLREVLAANVIHSSDRSLMEKGIPATIKQLEAGLPFPDWADIWRLK